MSLKLNCKCRERHLLTRASMYQPLSRLYSWIAIKRLGDVERDLLGTTLFASFACTL